jgi:hypothetical protein
MKQAPVLRILSMSCLVIVDRRAVFAWLLISVLAGCMGCRKEEPLPAHVMTQINNGPPQRDATTTVPVVTRPLRIVNSVPDWRVNGALPVYEKWDMQETAARSLGRIGPAAVPELILALQDPNPLLRRQAASVLARIGPDAKSAVPALTALLDDPDERVRKTATYALGQIGPAAAEAVPVLMQVIREHAADQHDSQPAGSASPPPSK